MNRPLALTFALFASLTVASISRAESQEEIEQKKHLEEAEKTNADLRKLSERMDQRLQESRARMSEIFRETLERKNEEVAAERKRLAQTLTDGLKSSVQFKLEETEKMALKSANEADRSKLAAEFKGLKLLIGLAGCLPDEKGQPRTKAKNKAEKDH